MQTLQKARFSLAGLVATSMALNPFRKKTEAPVPKPVARRVVVEGVATAPSLPTPPPPPPTDPLKQRLLFHGLHQDFNPSESVKTSQMTCPSCQTSFRIFLNSDGKKTVVKCPSCAKYYKV